MKKIPQLLKASLTAAAALMIIALPGCHKEDSASPAPSDAEKIPTAQEAQNDSQPLEAPKAPETNADQDLQMLKDAADAKNDFRGPANIYGPVVSHRHIIKEPIPETSVELQSPEVTGSLDWRVIARVVKHYSRQLRACYTKELAKTKDLEETATITWNITKDGNVSSAVLKESTLNNKNMESCLIKTVENWRFPHSKTGEPTQATYTISFAQ